MGSFGEMGMGGWFVIGLVGFLLYRLVRPGKGKANAGIPYPQALEDYRKESGRIEKSNMTSAQREQRLQQLSSRLVRVNGAVHDVVKKNYGSQMDIIVDVDGFGQVTCFVTSERSMQQANSLSKGQEVNVLGTFNQYSISQWIDMNDNIKTSYYLHNAYLA